MDEHIIREVLKKLITDNSSKLVSGLSKQGQSREIFQVSTSSLTPIRGYYFVSIWVDSPEVEADTNIRNVGVPPSRATYPVVIEIGDYAVGTAGEDQLYEDVDRDFQLFGDRIVDLIRKSYWLKNTETGKKYHLEETRSVSKKNLSDVAQSASEYHAMLYSRITFNIIDDCTDPETLY